MEQNNTLVQLRPVLVFFWCSFSVARFCLRNWQREAVGAERMRLSRDKSRSGMIMLVRESWAYPDRQYGFPACSLLSVTSNTHTHTHTHLHTGHGQKVCVAVGSVSDSCTVWVDSLNASTVLNQGPAYSHCSTVCSLNVDLSIISDIFLHSIILVQIL